MQFSYSFILTTEQFYVNNILFNILPVIYWLLTTVKKALFFCTGRGHILYNNSIVMVIEHNLSNI